MKKEYSIEHDIFAGSDEIHLYENGIEESSLIISDIDLNGVLTILTHLKYRRRRMPDVSTETKV